MRQTANGEVSSQNMTPMTNVSTTQRTVADITNVTPTSVLDFAQMKSIKNKNAYQRRKERNSPTTPIEISHMDPYSFVYNGIPKEHRVLKVQQPCVHCGAKRFQFEFPTFCCIDGKTKLSHSSIPEELLNLFTSRNELGRTFRQMIRCYNSNFCFASIGVNYDKTLTNMTSGVYTFCVNGGIYHRIDQLIPRDRIPRYLQLYFYDADYEMSHRLQRKNIDKEIAGKLIRVLDTNPYVKTFQRLADLGPLDNYRVTLNASVELDQRVYNRPTTSEFVVDIYIKLETSRLDFYRKNQSKIRADLYQGVVDCVNVGEVRPTMIGQRVVLPASFIGGPRDMRRRFLDAMTLVQDDGKPDIFLTMTCNPNWPEIKNELLPWQTAQDQPDLVSRVFRAKLEDLKKQLLNKHVLGVVGSYVYVIEFQKRGFPHAHFLLIIMPPYKLTNADHYDKIVCAEIPYPIRNAVLDTLDNSMKQHYKERTHILCTEEEIMVHLPNQQLVRFSEDDTLTSVVEKERDNRSMLTAFFLKNKEDMRARECKYRDFPKKFTWDPKSHRWNHRKLGLMRGRLVSANPAEGERYYLRLLLLHISGPTCFEDLYTVNNIKYPTFRKAALERGLIESDDGLSQCLTEASLFQFPNALRRLFATILSFCEPRDVRKLWHEHYNGLSEDYRRQYGSVERVQNMDLIEIMVFLQSMGDRIDDFDLPKINQNVDLEFGVFREVQEECSIVLEHEHLQARDSLNPEQNFAYDEIMRHVHNDIPEVFFIDGPGGTGKTFLYKALLANVRSCGHTALATASSGVAANNMPGGRTAHSRFKIPINLENNSVYKISRQSGTAQLLQTAKVIIWDEASMAKRHALEAVDRTMKDITGVMLPFGGKIMVLGDFLLRIGDGVEDTVHGNFIRIPDDMVIPFTKKEKSLHALIDAIFPSFEINRSEPDYIISHAILSTRNDSVDEINDYLIGRFHGEEQIYYSFDEAVDDINNFYPVVFLNTLSVSGLPPHYLRLKVGCPIILLRNLDPSNGLCNGTRLICKSFQHNVIDVEIAVGQHAGKRVFLPRIPLSPSEDDMFPFKLKRKQFPIRLCFAITINKA
uniref:ATP-dependent DNA helicase n=1 Tax=Lactuca sativa TaxID=4236 RepID=A0A9R1XKP8_LACSA|nr:hypothetical protein LSAT_V11C300144770 [Lactuca sativa]